MASCRKRKSSPCWSPTQFWPSCCAPSTPGISHGGGPLLSCCRASCCSPVCCSRQVNYPSHTPPRRGGGGVGGSNQLLFSRCCLDQCTQHTDQCTQYTDQYTQHTDQCTQHTDQCTQHTDQCTVHSTLTNVQWSSLYQLLSRTGLPWICPGCTGPAWFS